VRLAEAPAHHHRRASRPTRHLLGLVDIGDGVVVRHANRLPLGRSLRVIGLDTVVLQCTVGKPSGHPDCTKGLQPRVGPGDPRRTPGCYRTTTVGHDACVRQRWLTEPSSSSPKPPRPRAPTTNSSAVDAVSMSARAGRSLTTSAATFATSPSSADATA